MVSDRAYAKEQERKVFLRKAPTFIAVTREAMTRVQFMKTRNDKAFKPGTEEYTFYPRAKRALSKMEYSQRQMREAESDMILAESLEDTNAYKEADKKYEQHMSKALYYAFGVGQLYNQFLERAPVESL